MTTGKRPTTMDRIHELLIFKPGVGLVWRVPRGSAAAGRRAGGHHHTGIERIGIDRAVYRLDEIVDLCRRGSTRETKQRSA